MLTSLLADLAAEHADLKEWVRQAGLDLEVPSDPWDVRDVVSHLLMGDRKATLAATDPAGFAAELPLVLEDPVAFLNGWLDVGQGLSSQELEAQWSLAFADLLAALAQVPDGVKLPWYGPPMSPMSAATARLMEYWAHGQDVVDALGARRAPTTRLRHIAHLGFRTRGFSYAVRGMPVPEGEVRVTLTAPDGEVWEWGSGADAIEGSAEDFCLRVTQRRHRSDTALVATGPLADDWLDHAQCFAGLPTAGREPR